MAQVNLKGIFMGANLKKTVFDGKEKTNLYIDLYQNDSDDAEKAVQIKADDISLFEKLSKNFSVGSPFSCLASVTAYKNKAYFKLLSIV